MITKIAVQRYEKFSLHRKFFLLKSLFLTIHEADVLPEAVKSLVYYCVIPKGTFATCETLFQFQNTLLQPCKTLFQFQNPFSQTATSVFKTVLGYCCIFFSSIGKRTSPRC